MPRFECEATINFSYIVTAANKEEAEVLLAEALGPDWDIQCSSPDVEHPQIDEAPYYSEISCLGPVEETMETLS
jgi:hypothetical protein